MSDRPLVATDRLGVWCGRVLMGVAVLTPLLAWVAPLAFAPVMGLAGLLCLPALRIADEDRPLAVVLLAALVWAAISTTWSPFRPDDLESTTILKLALQLPLYWAVWCAARRAPAHQRRRILQVLAWGMAALGLVMLVEAFTGGAIYQTVRGALYPEPIRPDLARKNIAQGSFVLALLWPLAAAGGIRAGAPAWLAIPMAAGVAALAWMFGSDAPVIALPLSVAVGLAVFAWPRSAPKVFGLAAAGYFLLAPAIVLGVRSLARAAGWSVELQASWAQRVGYWSRAIDWLADKPLVGWGLDASRRFGPGIQLHPHNGALQVWLELGALGAACAALVWALALRRLSRPGRDLVAAAAAASAATYLLFGAFNFGFWQEWWLALGAHCAVIATLTGGDLAPRPTLKNRRTAAKASTSPSFSG